MPWGKKAKPPPGASNDGPPMRQVAAANASPLARPLVAARPPPPPPKATKPKKTKSKLSDASSEAPPSYASGSVAVATPSRNQIIAVLNSMQATPSNAIVAAIQREPFDPLQCVRLVRLWC